MDGLRPSGVSACALVLWGCGAHPSVGAASECDPCALPYDVVVEGEPQCPAPPTREYLASSVVDLGGLPNVVPGDVFICSTSDRAHEAVSIAVEEIHGDLVIARNGGSSLVFAGLRRVDGEIRTLWNNSSSLEFPLLEEAGGIVMNDSLSVGELRFPLLRRAGRVVIGGLWDSVTAVTLDALQAVGSLSFSGLRSSSSTGAATRELTLPALEVVQRLGWHPFGRLSLPSLQRVGQVEGLSQDDEVVLRLGGGEIIAPGLELVEGYLVAVRARVESIDLPRLRAVESFYLESNPSLEVLSLPELREVRRHFAVRENSRLSTCALEELLARLSSPPEVVEIVGNGDPSDCL